MQRLNKFGVGLREVWAKAATEAKSIRDINTAILEWLTGKTFIIQLSVCMGSEAECDIRAEIVDEERRRGTADEANCADV